MFCVSCGTKVVDESSFCSSCGARIVTPVADDGVASTERSVGSDASSATPSKKGGFVLRVSGVLALLWGTSIWLIAASSRAEVLTRLADGALFVAYGAALLQRDRNARWLGPLIAFLFTLGVVTSGLSPILVLADVVMVAFVGFLHVQRDELFSKNRITTSGRNRASRTRLLTVAAVAVVALAVVAFAVVTFGFASHVTQTRSAQAAAASGATVRPEYQQSLRERETTQKGAPPLNSEPPVLRADDRFAPVKNPNSVGDLDSQAKCATQAALFYANSHIPESGMNGYVNHFNARLNRCFVSVQVVTALGNEGSFLTDRAVYDAFEGSMVANIQLHSGDPDQGKNRVVECSVTLPSEAQRTCRSEEEFKAMARVYMDLP